MTPIDQIAELVSRAKQDPNEVFFWQPIINARHELKEISIELAARLIAAEARANAYENTLAQLAAQSTGRIGSTLKSDCMAALASAALRAAILTASADGAGR